MKKRLIKYSAAFLLMLLTVLVLNCCTEEPRIKNYQVRVALRECDGLTILSDSVVDVTAGKEVTFNVSISDDYVYLGNTANAYYDARRGRVTVSHNIYPTTVELILVPKSELLHFEFEKNLTLGTVYLEEGDEWMTEPGQVTVSAEAFSGYTFDGWSVGGFLTDGGQLVSTDPVYTFWMDQNTKLYSNFTNLTAYTIVYDANGGNVARNGEATDNTVYKVTSEWKTLFPMQQTIHSNNTFVRTGYQPVGYSTAPVAYEDFETVNSIPDFSNMGGICQVGSSGTLKLYVVWARETEASKFTFGNGIISGYSGNSKTVVIPEKIGGREVTAIASNAFSGNVITKVVIPKTVKSIAENAFAGCSNLKEVVFFDGVETVYNSSFSGCYKLSNIVLNSCRLPKYSGSAEGSFCIKYERFRTLEGKKICVVSGSSTLNGLDSDVFEANFPGYSVVNYGTNAANSSLFFIDAISKYVKEGDIIIHAPEWTSSNPMGAATIVPKTFRANEQCYDIFREVDMTKYSNFWDSWRKFQQGDPNDSSLTPALNLGGKAYQQNTNMNFYGDLMNVRAKPTKDSFGNPTTGFNYNILNYSGLNAINEVIKANGGTLLMSFATFDLGCMNPSVANTTNYDKFTADCQSKLNYPVISNVGTYIMEHQYFYDSQYHCNDTGAAIRTQNLTNDLRSYLNSVGK